MVGRLVPGRVPTAIRAVVLETIKEGDIMLIRLSRAWGIAAAALSLFTLAQVVWADEADVLFDDTYVRVHPV